MQPWCLEYQWEQKGPLHDYQGDCRLQGKDFGGHERRAEQLLSFQDGTLRKEWHRYAALMAASVFKSVVVNIKPVS